jgi:protein-tyrosine kinase
VLVLDSRRFRQEMLFPVFDTGGCNDLSAYHFNCNHFTKRNKKMGRLSDAWNRAEVESLEIVRSSAGTACETDPKPSVLPSGKSPDSPLSSETQGFVSEVHSDGPKPFPREWNPDARRLVFLNGNGSNGHHAAVAEQFRHVSSLLYKIRQTRPVASILVSSAMPREGRSFIAANLAHVLAQQPDKRVLLIDGDMRKPSMDKFFGTCAEPGLSDYLARRVDAPAIIQRGPIRGLFLIPSGGRTVDSAELLANGRLRSLLERAARFDWILVDSPATSSVCDASIMAEACDGVLLVVQATKTPSALAEKAVQQFGGRPVLGAVVNRSDWFRSYRRIQKPAQI